MIMIRYNRESGEIEAYGQRGYVSGRDGCALLEVEQLPDGFCPTTHCVRDGAIAEKIMTG